VSHGSVPPSSVSRRYRFGFGAFCQLKPFVLPSGPVAGFDPGARAGNIEYITAALLCLRHKTQGLAAERMVGCEEVKHLVFLAFRYSYEITAKKPSQTRYFSWTDPSRRRELTAKVAWLVALI